MATPLGNLQDITERALEVLRGVHAIAAEDTRVARTLLQHFQTRTPAFALHEHNEARGADRVIELLRQGKPVAMVSDAGTPALSDPGALLVRRVREAGLRVVPVPGPSALAAAVSVAGLEEGRFLFLGFLPSQPSARQRVLEEVARLPYSLVLYEAPHRILETVADLARALGGERALIIAREMTKMFETIHACALHAAASWLADDPNRLKGEFVLVVEGAESKRDAQAEEGEHVLGILLAELPVKQAVRLAVSITGAKRNALYERALALTGKV